MSEEILSEILSILRYTKTCGPAELARKMQMSKTNAWYYLQKLITLGEVERTIRGKYRLRRPSIEQFLSETMEGYKKIAYAPFCPVLAGGHAVLRDCPALLIPMNAYVGVGIRPNTGKGGEVTLVDYPEVTYRVRGPSLSFDMIQQAKMRLADEIYETIGVDRNKLPNFSARIYSTIDLSQGCGGSAALAVAITIGLLSIVEEKDVYGPFEKGTAEFNRVLGIAYKVEQFIHGKGSIPKGAAPYSSGASVVGSILGGTKGKLYKYKIDSAELLDGKREAPDFKLDVICQTLPLELLVVLGRSKSTADCLARVVALHDELGESLPPSFFSFWQWLVDGLADAFKKGSLSKISKLLDIQHCLYSALGLASEEFSNLSTKIAVMEGVGGSMVGGGMGGAFIISTTQSADVIKQLILGDSSLLVLPKDCLTSSLGAQLIAQ